jgi:hypothetical protein
MTIAATAASEILRGQRMPPEEIRAVITADDPVLVGRLLELHLERLGEWLEEQRRLVAWIEGSAQAAERGERAQEAGEVREVSDRLDET